jgi:carbonic anhydrase
VRIFFRLLVEENVRLKVKHLAMLSMLRGQWATTPGIPRIHGWVYDIATGLITDLAKADATLANTWKD